MDTTVAKLQPENAKQVQKFLKELLQRSRLPGISVAMSVDGVTVGACAGVAGPGPNDLMNAAMHFELGCVNKLLVAIVVLELANRGVVQLDAAIASYLPDLSGENGDRITSRHLLSHSAGYQGENIDDPDVAQDYSWAEFTSSFNQRPLLFEPGTLFDYSHSSAVILAKIVAAVTGRKVSDWIEELVFAPLGIRVITDLEANRASCIRGHSLNLETGRLHQRYPVEWCDFWSASLGGPWITMRDLLKIGMALMDQGPGALAGVRDQLLARAVTLPGQFVGDKAEQPYFVFGLGCARFPTGSYGVRSKSRGQCCAVRFCLARKIAIAVGINAEAPYYRDLVISKLFNSMLPEDAQSLTELLPIPETAFSLDEFIGTYRNAAGRALSVRQQDDRLFMRHHHNAASDSTSTREVAIFSRNENCNIKRESELLPLCIGAVRSNHSTGVNLMIGDSFYQHQ